MWARLTRFEGARPEDVGTMGDEIRARSEGGPPEGLPAVGLTVLTDAEAGRVTILTLFETQEDLRTGDAFLNAMEPPAPMAGRRAAVETYEVAVERRPG
jgi:hypothetical protein